MDYKSPIDVQVLKTTQEIIHKFDEAIMSKVTETLNINIDKDELIKALAYDRGQYEDGFKSGYRAALDYVISIAKEKIKQEGK